MGIDFCCTILIYMDLMTEDVAITAVARGSHMLACEQSFPGASQDAMIQTIFQLIGYDLGPPSKSGDQPW